MEQKQFDVTANIEIVIPHPDGDKTVVVRWPTDQEWIDYSTSQEIVFSPAGRGETHTEVEGGATAAADLVALIRQNETIVDGAEAERIVDQLRRTRIDEIARTGSQVEIRMRVPGADTVHVIRIPSQAQVQAYRRKAMRLVQGRRSRQILRTNWAADADLYDALLFSVTGYASEVPVVHKVVVVTEVLAELAGSTDDPEF